MQWLMNSDCSLLGKDSYRQNHSPKNCLLRSLSWEAIARRSQGNRQSSPPGCPKRNGGRECLLGAYCLGQCPQHITRWELSLALQGGEGMAWSLTELPVVAGETGYLPAWSFTALGLGAYFLVSSPVCKWSLISWKKSQHNLPVFFFLFFFPWYRKWSSSPALISANKLH